MVERNDHVSIDLERLADSIKVARENLDPLSENCCIYEVPPITRMSKNSLYTPKVVSIGPLHYGKKKFEVMEEHKLRYLNKFLQRTPVSTSDFLKFIKREEVNLRNCYADTIKYRSESFVKIIFLDAVFLIEIFIRGLRPQIVDRVFSNPGKIKDIVFDIMLLENQLPMFILRDLFEFAELEGSLSSIACEFLTHFVCRDFLKDPTSMQEHFLEAEHFVDLVRLCLQWPPNQGVNRTQPQTDSSNVGIERQDDRETALNVTAPNDRETQPQTDSSNVGIEMQDVRETAPNDRETQPQTDSSDVGTERQDDRETALNVTAPNDRETQPQTDSSNVGSEMQDDRESAPNVTNLHRCGITLKSASTNNLLDIKFTGGILEIPKLTITNMTIHLLRNLQVFESLHCDTNSINDYHILLHRLLSTPEDVELLIRAGVIENRVLDSEGVSKLFRELSADARVIFNHFNYSDLVKNLQVYTRSKRHEWMAMLKQKHCSNPWVVIPVFVAFVILVLTVLQTIGSVRGPFW